MFFPGLAAKVARNDSLARFLENRPDQKELEEKNILHKSSEEEITSDRHEKAIKLGRKLSMRPTAEELEQRNILHGERDDEYYTGGRIMVVVCVWTV